MCGSQVIRRSRTSSTHTSFSFDPMPLWRCPYLDSCDTTWLISRCTTHCMLASHCWFQSACNPQMWLHRGLPWNVLVALELPYGVLCAVPLEWSCWVQINSLVAVLFDWIGVWFQINVCKWFVVMSKPSSFFLQNRAPTAVRTHTVPLL